ncbi:hypothetical protein ACWKWV_09760 [Castellaniella ginsengisoli]
MAGINGNFAAGLSSGLNGAVRAIFGGQDAYNNARMQGGLMGAQTAKYATDAAEASRLSGLRQDQAFLAGLAALYGPEAVASFQAGGAADKFGDNALTAQKYQFRNQVLGNIGDPGTDPSKINMGTSVIEGKTYEPYAAVGDTGVVLDKGAGTMSLGNNALLDLHGLKSGTSGRQVVDTPSGVQIVDTRTGVAMPATAGGTPLMGQRAQDATEAQRKTSAARAQARLGFNDATNSLDNLAATAQELANHPSLGGITGIQGVFPNIPGGGAANAEAQLKNLKSRVGFAVLQAMREASKTGGALGAISDKENELLQNNLAALDTAQSPEEFRRQLLRIVDYANGVKQRMADAYAQQYGAAPTAGGTEPSAPARTVVRRGTLDGRPVVQYSDGSMEFSE